MRIVMRFARIVVTGWSSSSVWHFFGGQELALDADVVGVSQLGRGAPCPPLSKTFVVAPTTTIASSSRTRSSSWFAKRLGTLRTFARVMLSFPPSIASSGGRL